MLDGLKFEWQYDKVNVIDKEYRKQMIEKLNTWSKEIIDGYKKDEEERLKTLDELQKELDKCREEEENERHLKQSHKNLRMAK